MKSLITNIIAVVSAAMIFTSCAQQNKLYRWEKDAIASIADAAICYGGHSARNPYLWTPERFEKTVIYKDEKGQEHWLFDNMIMMELWDDDYNVTYSIANDGRYSSRKEHWQGQLDYWFDARNGFAALDRCIENVAQRIGKPSSKRGIIFSLPDPVYFEHYTDAMRGENRNTVYWGEVDGVAMDFATPEDRIKAYRSVRSLPRQNIRISSSSASMSFPRNSRCLAASVMNTSSTTSPSSQWQTIATP